MSVEHVGVLRWSSLLESSPRYPRCRVLYEPRGPIVGWIMRRPKVSVWQAYKPRRSSSDQPAAQLNLSHDGELVGVFGSETVARRAVEQAVLGLKAAGPEGPAYHQQR